MTHISKAMLAEDIIRSGAIGTSSCDVLNREVAYFFYGRPAYRIGHEGAVKVEAACPFCFIFDPTQIENADVIHAFDTGAFANRMYNHILQAEMEIDDFSLERDIERPNRLISHVFGSLETYFDGNTSKIVSPEDGAEPYEFHARAYLQLLASPGRNEPDDRICSIEVVRSNPTVLNARLMSVIVPITLWNKGVRAPWLEELHNRGVQIMPYIFVPGRHPEHYHALLESAVRDLYIERGILQL